MIALVTLAILCNQPERALANCRLFVHELAIITAVMIVCVQHGSLVPHGKTATVEISTKVKLCARKITTLHMFLSATVQLTMMILSQHTLDHAFTIVVVVPNIVVYQIIQSS